MNPEQFFTQLLELSSPFSVERVETVLRDGIIEKVVLHIAVASDYRLAGYSYRHSTHHRRWQHLHLFQYPCFIECDVPVFQNKDSGETMQLPVPWSRPGSGFTLLFESYALALIQMTASVAVTARHLGLYPHRVQTLYDAYTKLAYQESVGNGIAAPETIGVDETNCHKGHDYITIAVDMDSKEILGIEDGKSSDALLAIAKRMDEPQRVKAVSLDMSPAFIAGSRESFPNATLTFDRFHVMRLVNRTFRDLHRPTNAPHHLLHWWQEQFSLLYQQATTNDAKAFLCYWCDSLEEAGIKADTLLRTLRSHAEGIVSFVETRLTNGLLEGINSKIQYIKRAARGYRHTKNFKRMILFVFGVIKPQCYSFSN